MKSVVRNIVLAAVMATTATAVAAQPAFASPPKRTISGCSDERVSLKSRVKSHCCTLPGYSEYRAIGRCATGNFVYGPWVRVGSSSDSISSACITYVRDGHGTGGYYHEGR